ncbi:MAG: hypothetical protein R6U50_12625 [Desulfobacterales bacterium]
MINSSIISVTRNPQSLNIAFTLYYPGAPIDCSNLMLVCSKCMMPTRIKMTQLEDGKKVRTCSKCNEIID